MTDSCDMPGLRGVESTLYGLGCSLGPRLGLVLVELEAVALEPQAGGLERGGEAKADGLVL
jgi:hypothetical protein